MPKIGCVNHDCDKCRAAAQRQWVGLTDEDKLHIEIMGGKSDVMLAEMVEAKLKEKNTWVGLTRWEIDAKLKEKNT
jgi:hypothetical protein